MTLDKDATSLCPPGWEVWTTGRRWQAMRKGAKPEDKGAWGPMRGSGKSAVEDAVDLEVVGTLGGGNA